MVFKGILLAVAMAGAGMASPAAAQGNLRLPADKLIAADATGGAAMAKGRPWWAGLADCSWAFKTATPINDKHRDFGAQALLRMMEDRGITMEAAGAIVMPYINSQRVVREAMLSGYGRAAYEKSCDALMVQYKAL